jgi:hypothetical protein
MQPAARSTARGARRSREHDEPHVGIAGVFDRARRHVLGGNDTCRAREDLRVDLELHGDERRVHETPTKLLSS